MAWVVLNGDFAIPDGFFGFTVEKMNARQNPISERVLRIQFDSLFGRGKTSLDRSLTIIGQAVDRLIEMTKCDAGIGQRKSRIERRAVAIIFQRFFQFAELPMLPLIPEMGSAPLVQIPSTNAVRPLYSGAVPFRPGQFGLDWPTTVCVISSWTANMSCSSRS